MKPSKQTLENIFSTKGCKVLFYIFFPFGLAMAGDHCLIVEDMKLGHGIVTCIAFTIALISVLIEMTKKGKARSCMIILILSALICVIEILGVIII